MEAGQVCSLASLQCAHLRKPTDICERHSVIRMKLALAHQSRVAPAHSSRGRGKTVPPCILYLLFSVTCAYCSASTSETLGPTSMKCQTDVVGVPTSMSALGGRIEALVRTSPECAWSATTRCDLAASPAAFGTGRGRHYAPGRRESTSERTHRRDSRQWPRRMLAQAALFHRRHRRPRPRRRNRQPRPRRRHRQPRPRSLHRRPRPRRRHRRPRPRRLHRRPRPRRLHLRPRRLRACPGPAGTASPGPDAGTASPGPDACAASSDPDA